MLPTGIEPIKALPTDHPMLANAPEYEDIYGKRRAPVRLSHLTDYIPKSIALETARKLNYDGVSEWLERTCPTLSTFECVVKPILMVKYRRLKGKHYSQQPGWWDHWAKMRSLIRERLKHQRHMLVLTGSAGGGKSTASRENLTTFADISQNNQRNRPVY